MKGPKFSKGVFEITGADKHLIGIKGKSEFNGGIVAEMWRNNGMSREEQDANALLFKNSSRLYYTLEAMCRLMEDMSKTFPSLLKRLEYRNAKKILKDAGEKE